MEGCCELKGLLHFAVCHFEYLQACTNNMHKFPVFGYVNCGNYGYFEGNLGHFEGFPDDFPGNTRKLQNMAKSYK
jgi:hypothetical protein